MSDLIEGETGFGLTARSVHLTPVLPDHYRDLHAIAHSPAVAATWVARGQTVALEDFPRLLWDGAVSAFTVLSKRTGAVLGYTGLVNHDARSGTAYLSAFLDPTVPPTAAAGGESLALAVHHGFTALNLRKVYAETSEASIAGVGSAAFRALPVVEEGRLRDHIPSGDGFRDSVVLAVYRERFEAEFVRLVGRRPAERFGERDDPADRDVFRAVVTAIADVTGDPGCRVDGGHVLADDLGLDSLSVVEVLASVEEQLDRTASEDGLLSLRTVRDLVDLFASA